MPGARTKPTAAKRPSKPTTPSKRKRAVFDVDEAETPEPRASTLFGQRVVLLKTTSWLNNLARHDDTEEERARRKKHAEAVDHPKKIVDLRCMFYFVHHGLDPDHAGERQHSTYKAYYLADIKKKSAIGKMQSEIIKFLKEQVDKEVDAQEHSGTDLAALTNMTTEQRIERIWEPLFDKNAIAFAKAMWEPVDHIVDFHAMFQTPDSVNDEAKQLMGRWRHYVMAVWAGAADATFRYRTRPERDADSAPEREPGDSIYAFWKTLPKEVDAPSIDALPVHPGQGYVLSRKRAKKVVSPEFDLVSCEIDMDD